ncbi:hypothetical protein INS49_014915 [Diaporthe citri]|uniref:uncharacterized protein n=1 Tax=Diaporthe citri TaxID=83186 RepID=UPI001C814FDB|nr:uncharacterized protein INS49_014915 [Diaporthe citri]KAG6357039.1 hypothetical protein INS49_014915 [Diaporthe citri]
MHIRRTRSVHAHATDPIPSSLTDLIRFLSAKDSDQDGRPAKRRKTDGGGPESVPIIREQLVISRTSRHTPLDSTSSHASGVHSQLRFGLTASDAKAKPAHSYIFTVSTKPSFKGGNFSIAFPLRTRDVSDRFAAIIAARDVLWSDPGTEDAIWVDADVRLDEDDGTTVLTFNFQVNWNVSTTTFATAFSPYQQKFRREILAEAFPELFAVPRQKKQDSCSPQMFYEAAHIPDAGSTPPEDFAIEGMNATLYPFQRRAVRWMLGREGVQWCGRPDGNDSVVKNIAFEPFDAPSAFAKIRDADGQVCYISKLLGKITKNPAPFENLEQNFRGGILSEEMGLGKTVEILALCLLNRQPAESVEAFDHYLGEKVKTTPATLIVCPSSLKKQWLSELSKHAPSLDVMAYNGLNQQVREDQSMEKALIEDLASHDVVVTTYNVLTSELDYALGEPDRARRNPRKYHRPRSPLTQLLWWRVCLDEAQMIESGVSKAATLARLLPRVNAWGVTGTPVKDSVEDLRGLLLFLRYEPYASNIPAWNALLSSNQDGFRRLFNQLSLRHSKRLVRHEIAIPAQKRYVITMPFTAVEEQHYQTLFREVVDACGLDTQGNPIRDGWDPEDPGVLEGMRTALDRLRQTALHPEVGHRNRRALGHRKGPMRTVAEVLDVMIEQSEVSRRADQRALLSAKLTRGQLLENSPRVGTALEIWQGVLGTIDNIVKESREKLQFEIQVAKSSTGDRAAVEDDANDEDINTGPSVFFCANAHFQIKSNEDMTVPDSDDFRRLEKLEVDGYESAKKIRREILDESRRKAERLMKKISDAASKQTFAVIPEYKSVDKRGIESRAAVEDLELLAASLNEQADQLDDWREHVIQLLLKALVDEDDEVEITGDEYEDSTKLMEEIVVYIQILRAAIADREDVVTGQTNELVEHEARVSLQQAFTGEGPFPEKVMELFAVRDRIKPKPDKETADLRSLRAVVAKLRTATVKLRHEVANGSNRAKLELDIVTEQLKTTQKQLSEQQKVAQTMNSELDLFTSTMNARVDFYRQLQNVSDSVAPYEGPSGDDQMNAMLRQEEVLAEKLEASNAKHRYLLHLKEMDARDGDQRFCIICRENFTVGVLTVCGHQFCKDCITLWFRAHHNCPVCKKRLNSSSLHDITLKPQELKVHSDSTTTSPKKSAENHDQNGDAPAKKSAIYSEFSAEKLAEIKDIDLDGPAFTTKVDNLVRHLLWLRESDPGAKSIVFSQYSDFLNVLRLAFQRYRIGFTSFDKANGAADFKEDDSIECFLLHARAHSSGLNLVNASHVFLCEPLINTALELQAIARVHRIGQDQETTVWLYIVDGTVEESIYNLSVRRRMAHIGDNTRSRGKGKSTEATPEPGDEAIEAANSMELEHARLSKLMRKGKAAGEAVDKGDLWECLFGHLALGRQAANGAGGTKEPGPAIRGFLAAEAAEQRRGEGSEGPLRLVNGI